MGPREIARARTDRYRCGINQIPTVYRAWRTRELSLLVYNVIGELRWLSLCLLPHNNLSAIDRSC